MKKGKFHQEFISEFLLELNVKCITLHYILYSIVHVISAFLHFTFDNFPNFYSTTLKMQKRIF